VNLSLLVIELQQQFNLTITWMGSCRFTVPPRLRKPSLLDNRKQEPC
jgi:hypothetical protein